MARLVCGEDLMVRIWEGSLSAAQRSAHTLNSLLRQSVFGWAEAKMACGYAVHFSGADRIQGRFPPHASPLITLLHGDLRQLQNRLENIARHFGSPQAKPQHDLIRRAIDRLRPEFQLIQTFSTQLQTQEQGLQRLTRQQIQVLDLMRESKRLLIRGCAGSGKTLLALEKAARLAATGNVFCCSVSIFPLRSGFDRESTRNNLLSMSFTFTVCVNTLRRRQDWSFQFPPTAAFYQISSTTRLRICLQKLSDSEPDLATMP